MEKKKSITHWLVNIQHNPTSKDDPQDRDWRDMEKYGFWGANGVSRGRSNRYVVQKLSVGDQIFAYSSKGDKRKKNGYVGYGIIVQSKKPPMMAKNFIPQGFGGKRLFELPLECSYMKDNEKYPVDDEDLGERVVGVQWLKTFPIENPIWEKGLFFPQQIACKIDWSMNNTYQETIEFLKANFDIS